MIHVLLSPRIAIHQAKATAALHGMIITDAAATVEGDTVQLVITSTGSHGGPFMLIRDIYQCDDQTDRAVLASHILDMANVMGLPVNDG